MRQPKSIADLIGKTFNELTILQDLGYERFHRHILAKCSCGGNYKCILLPVLRGKCKMCKECSMKKSAKMSTKHGLHKHPLYHVYYSMINRCYDPNPKTGYELYGARGVTVCTEWRNSFKAFADWALSNGWQKGLQIDKDIKGNGLLYSPETCCIVTPKENANNRRPCRHLEYKGEIKTAAQWADLYKIPRQSFYQRLWKGWSAEEIITTPIHYRH